MCMEIDLKIVKRKSCVFFKRVPRFLTCSTPQHPSYGSHKKKMQRNNVVENLTQNDLLVL